MSDGRSRVTERAAELRLAFDRAFAGPVRLDTSRKENFLAVRVGAERYALRLSEITGLFADKKVTRVPGGETALLGIAGFRGAILPVYSLQTLLGHSSTETPRWLVIASAAPVAFAFEAFECQLSALPDAILPQQSRTEMRSYARDFLQTQSFAGPIMHLPSVVDAIKSPRPEGLPKEER
jgi:chemotaxis signal transduction protein